MAAQTPQQLAKQARQNRQDQAMSDLSAIARKILGSDTGIQLLKAGVTVLLETNRDLQDQLETAQKHERLLADTLELYKATLTQIRELTFRLKAFSTDISRNQLDEYVRDVQKTLEDLGGWGDGE